MIILTCSNFTILTGYEYTYFKSVSHICVNNYKSIGSSKQ